VKSRMRHADTLCGQNTHVLQHVVYDLLLGVKCLNLYGLFKKVSSISK